MFLIFIKNELDKFQIDRSKSEGYLKKEKREFKRD